MALFRKKARAGIAAPVTQPAKSGVLAGLEGYVPLSTPENRLYYALREAVPVIDAAVFKTVRLTGGYRVECSDPRARKALEEFVLGVPVGGNRQGLHAFTESYLEQLITCGTALGEIVTDTAGRPAGLFNSPLENVEFRRAKDGFNIDIYVNGNGGQVKVSRPDLCLVSVLNPDPGALTGNSMLKGLPFVSGILLKIFESTGLNWERAGNLRFAVTYNPKNDSSERAFARERAEQIAGEWSRAMRKGAEVRDFVAVGDVQIKVIGGEAAIPDSEVPVRQMLEQIVAKTGIPPFMLGLSWSTTERVSAQQADALTAELESYRRILTPVILKICNSFLTGRGFAPGAKVIWDDITLQDEVEQSRAMLYRAQAKRTEREK